ncbi:hypothetical protein [Acetobacter lambici]|uniref:Uncharacterized protein n=1 Tax=Acetobacter lambici TaxID=1332824 RepID=A0ABT1EZH4_9PROT|nr:hypothetical protein [Acetobacter lambici]MCP1243264.1 hypothetical protein [Acetobacter lambici]MCP1258337.1 hypothetical protein [Acetobacter lambici]
MMVSHENNHAVGSSAGQPNVVRMKILPIVLVAGVMILGFEIAQQAIAERYARKNQKLGGIINGLSASDVRPNWVLRVYYGSGCAKAVWWIRNPRQVCLRLRFALFYAVLWFVWANAYGRKIVKSHKQRLNVTNKVMDHLLETLSSTEGQP